MRRLSLDLLLATGLVSACLHFRKPRAGFAVFKVSEVVDKETGKISKIISFYEYLLISLWRGVAR